MISLIRRLLGATEEIEECREILSRREFGRRIFAIGAGFAVGGALIRQATWREVLDYAEPTPFYNSALSELYKKTNTDILIAMRRRVDEYDWFDDLPEVNAGYFHVSKDYEITLEPPRPLRMLAD